GDLGAGWAVTDRVVQQVCQHFFQPRAVPPADHGPLRERKHHLMIDQTRLVAADDPRDKLAEVDLGAVEVETIHPNPRDVEQPDRHLGHALHLLLHDLDPPAYVLRQAVGAAHDELQVAANGGERGAQLMGGDGQEVVLLLLQLPSPGDVLYDDHRADDTPRLVAQ